MDVLASVLIGTSGLAVAAIASLVLTIRRSTPAPRVMARIRKCAGACLLLQTGHFLEELTTQFYIAFPVALGLASWPMTFFAGFNLAWIAVWAFAIAWLPSLGRLGIFPIWFLGIASVANGIFHPALAGVTGGYFPGLWTSPLIGVTGLLLVRQLASRR